MVDDTFDPVIPERCWLIGVRRPFEPQRIREPVEQWNLVRYLVFRHLEPPKLPRLTIAVRHKDEAGEGVVCVVSGICDLLLTVIITRSEVLAVTYLFAVAVVELQVLVQKDIADVTFFGGTKIHRL